MAFTAMAVAPRSYDDLIRPLSVNNEKIASYLLGDVEFFFLRMLRAWYDTLNETEAEGYQRFLLSYRSDIDFKYDAERKWRQFLCPNLWRNKWKLICNTIPEDHMIPEMRRCYQELMRRFGRKYMAEKCDHYVRAASLCGGVVDDKTYARWPISNWQSSFLKLENKCTWREGRRPISLGKHADAFKRCVSSNPGRFYDFVLDISSRPDISDKYKIKGLEGLLAGGIDPYSLWNLAEQYITEEFAKKDCYAFSQIVEYYIKEENKYIDEIMELLKTLAISPFPENNRSFTEEDSKKNMSGRATGMLTKAINSYQGRAAELLVYMCAIPSRRAMVYKFFTDSNISLHESVRAIPLRYLNVKDYDV